MMFMESVDLTAGGKRVRMTSDDVVKKLKGVKPGRIRTHAVKINGVLHPVKEAFSEVTGLDLLDFNTNQARSSFKRLGFEVVRVSSE
jgi:hypothetical protein